MCKQAQTVLPIPSGGGLTRNRSNVTTRKKDKVVFVIGPTGTGKSKLSVELATRFSGEIINSDKIQLYKGLDVVTNKITEEEKCGVPHHLLGIADPDSEFTAKDFCNEASTAVESIVHKGQLPIIVGGSNSYMEALVDDKNNYFKTRYDCCFIWVNVYMPILHLFVSDRVDQMVSNGMVEEVRKVFNPIVNYDRGIRKAIGVPEFDKFFREEAYLDDKTRDKLLQEAINEVKNNTCKLACRQLEKIQRLRTQKGWRIHRIDATEVFIRRTSRDPADEAWERHVARPSAKIVREFLYNFQPDGPESFAAIRAMKMEGALAPAATC
uniref:adenylate dimethylallyltransferase (ADP/ATP-dependent) n=1 Tax=Kalanchoe fedtschenkoi TaxID=63787 RepID=A0A7N0TLV2_KALFE